MARANNGRENVGLPSVKSCETFNLIGGLLILAFVYQVQVNSLCAQDTFRSFAKQIIIYLDAIGRTCSFAVINAVKRYFGPNKPAPSFGKIMDERLLVEV